MQSIPTDIDDFLKNVWGACADADPIKPCIQKLYVPRDSTGDRYDAYAADGTHLGSGLLFDLLPISELGIPKIGEFVQRGFALLQTRDLPQDIIDFLCGNSSAAEFKTGGYPVLKVKTGVERECYDATGALRYYVGSFSLNQVDYYVTRELKSRCWPAFISLFERMGLSFQDVISSGEGQLMSNMLKDQARQLVTYGAPGTGKSHGTEGKVKEFGIQDVFRTTFHPDSDYSTFVGAYKPTMKKVPRIVQIGQDLKKPFFAADVEDELKVEEKISYEFRPQAFMNAYVAAWKNPTKPIVLIIEEINRGNCAQIFGDLFQLLDRDDVTGYSTYPITADTDLAKWLAARFGANGLADSSKPECIRTEDWVKVLKGEMLALPKNLYIWATMNTSDQSLFPIDSAFKRRWDWKYVPIREGKDKDGNKLDWKIKFSIPGKPAAGEQPAVPEKKFTYDWWKFLLCINKLIYKTTESEDKKLGYFFVKPDEKRAPEKEEKDVITANRFVDKVVFYLWNDVFKDYGIESVFKNEQIEKKENDEDGQAVAFERFFVEDGDKADPKVLAAFFKALEFEPDNVEEVDAPAATQQVPQEVPAEAPAAPVGEPVVHPAE